MPFALGHETNITHGQSGIRGGKPSPEYAAWASMRKRCYQPKNPSFKSYGGRGIRVCEQWRDSFESFLRDMGPRPSSKHSLDRVNNDLDYSHENCRWATVHQQQGNKQSTRRISAFGRTMGVCEWARERNLPKETIWRRLALGWSPEKALSTPVAAKNEVLARSVRAAGYNSISDFIRKNPMNTQALYRYERGEPVAPATLRRLLKILPLQPAPALAPT